MLERIMIKLKTNSYGFTLVELLVVVLIISVLSGTALSLLNTGGIRGKANDAQRIADIQKIQAALELYFADNRAYPKSRLSGADGWITIGKSNELLSKSLGQGYLSAIPADPSGIPYTSNGPCGNPHRYRYNYRSDGTYYLLTSIVEVETSSDRSPCNSLSNWGSNCSSSFGNIDVCYGVQNP
jgi:prepilin-type N-terminal cleavage/methylation domain-containing protein